MDRWSSFAASMAAVAEFLPLSHLSTCRKDRRAHAGALTKFIWCCVRLSRTRSPILLSSEWDLVTGEEAHMSSPGHFVSNTAGRRDGASPLHQQLKRETAGLHQRLEAKLGFFEPGFSIHRYVHVLQIFHGFYAPVEASLLRLTAVAPPLGFPLRARAELIERDLLALGLSRG